LPPSMDTIDIEDIIESFVVILINDVSVVDCLPGGDAFFAAQGDACGPLSPGLVGLDVLDVLFAPPECTLRLQGLATGSPEAWSVAFEGFPKHVLHFHPVLRTSPG